MKDTAWPSSLKNGVMGRWPHGQRPYAGAPSARGQHQETVWVTKHLPRKIRIGSLVLSASADRCDLADADSAAVFV